MTFSGDMLWWWCAALACLGLLCRYFYARDQRIARIFFWVLLCVFLTPLGALILYLLLSVLNRASPAATPHDTSAT